MCRHRGATMEPSVATVGTCGSTFIMHRWRHVANSILHQVCEVAYVDAQRNVAATFVDRDV